MDVIHIILMVLGFIALAIVPHIMDSISEDKQERLCMAHRLYVLLIDLKGKLLYDIPGLSTTVLGYDTWCNILELLQEDPWSYKAPAQIVEDNKIYKSLKPKVGLQSMFNSYGKQVLIDVLKVDDNTIDYTVNNSPEIRTSSISGFEEFTRHCSFVEFDTYKLIDYIDALIDYYGKISHEIK